MGHKSAYHNLPPDYPNGQPYISASTSNSEGVYYPHPYRYSQGEENYSEVRPFRPRQEENPPSIPPLSFEQTSFVDPFDDRPISLLPSAHLKRSPHIRRKERPKRESKLKHVPPPLAIVTDSGFSQRLSQQSTPPLSFTRSTPSPPPRSAYRPRPSPRGPSIRHESPERIDWPDSPSSSYSTMSAQNEVASGPSIYVEWDTTGYLQPDSRQDTLPDPESLFLPEEEGGGLKRQKTEVIVKLLRERRRRAGLE